jgi:hypothetical protein
MSWGFGRAITAARVQGIESVTIVNTYADRRHGRR